VGWTHSFNWSMTFPPSGWPIIRRGDGWADSYAPSGGCYYYTGGYGIPGNYPGKGVLCPSGAVYTLKYPNQTAYDFDNATGRLVQIHEPAGNRIVLSYTGANLTQITDTAGRVVALGYDAGNHINLLTDPLGRTVRYGYDGVGRLVSVTDMAGGVWRYTYQGADTQRITSVTDSEGRRRVLNTFNDAGQVTRQQEQDGQVTTFAYGSPVTMTDPRGTASSWSFDARGWWTSRSQAGLTVSQTYDSHGNRTSLTDRRANQTTWAYDAGGNLTSQTLSAVGGTSPVWRWDRDANNNAIRITDPLGNVLTRAFDPTTNVLLSEVRLFDSATTTYAYADTANPGLATKITLPRGGYSTFSYDSRGNLAQQVDPDGNTTTYSYDAAGRRLSMVDPDGNVSGGTPSLHTWQWQYDNLDRTTRTTDPLGNTRSWSYDSYGNATAATDARGNVTTSVYDGRGLLAQVRQVPVAGTTYLTMLTRDPNGNAARITQANGVYTDYVYDTLDRLTAVKTYPAGSAVTTSYTLDGNGNLTLKTLPDAQQIAVGYDALNRPTSLSTSGINQSFSYDLVGHRTSAAQTISGTTSTWSYIYDGAGRMTSASGPNGSVGYDYDLDDNRSSITATVGGVANTVTYTRKLSGRIQSVTEGPRISSYSYTAAGKTSQISIANGQLTRNYFYDRAQRLTSVTNRTGASIIGEFDYTLDAEGNRISLSENLSGISVPPTMDGFSFSYDGLNRLTSMTGPRSESFVFDGAGNITSRTGPSATYGIDGANRPTGDGSATYTWSSTDRFMSRGVDSFGYDNLDRLTQATVSGSTSVFSYDADSLLINRTSGGVSKDFLWDPASSPQRLLAATTNGTTDRVIYGNGPLYLLRGPAQAPVALATDGQGSVRAEVNASQQVTGSWRYALYGQIAQSSGAASPAVLAYTGQLLDVTGLYFLRARWYDPVTSRFLSRDAGGDGTGSAFAYGAGNPMSLYDPAGLSVDPQMGDDCECLAADPVASTAVDPDPPYKCGSDMNCHTEITPNPQSSLTTPEVLLTPGGLVVLDRATPPSGGPSTGPGGGGGGGGKSSDLDRVLSKVENALFRAGGWNPSNLSDPQLSVRNSLSEPWPRGANTVFRKEFLVIDGSTLPSGSVSMDHVPPGHGTINGVDVVELKKSIVFRGKLP
jgi:RHS repeat-associated protein